jgi:uncharacterized protein (TIRG00374 family)
MKRRVWTGVLVSAVFLALALYKTHFGQMAEAFRGANYIYFFPAVASTLVACLVRAVRWRFLMSPIKTIRVGPLFKASMIGMMANNILPFRLGDVAKAYAIGKLENVSKSASLGTVFVERVFDGLTLFSFLFLVLIMYPLPHTTADTMKGVVLFTVYVGALGFVVALVLLREPALRLLQYILRPLPETVAKKIVGVAARVADGFNVVRDVRALAIAAVLSVVNWLFVALTVYLLFFCFGMALPFSAALVVLTIVTLGIMVPAGPAALGTFELACRFALQLYGQEAATGLSFAFLFHASQFLPTTLVGLVYLWREKMSLLGLTEKEVSEANGGSAPHGTGMQPNHQKG